MAEPMRATTMRSSRKIANDGAPSVAIQKFARSATRFSGEFQIQHTSVARHARGLIACLSFAALALAACDAGAGALSRAQSAAAKGADNASGASLFAAAPDRRWRLPHRLNEISGLAVTREGALLG